MHMQNFNIDNAEYSIDQVELSIDQINYIRNICNELYSDFVQNPFRHTRFYISMIRAELIADDEVFDIEFVNSSTYDTFCIDRMLVDPNFIEGEKICSDFIRRKLISAKSTMTAFDRTTVSKKSLDKIREILESVYNEFFRSCPYHFLQKFIEFENSSTQLNLSKKTIPIGWLPDTSQAFLNMIMVFKFLNLNI